MRKALFSAAIVIALAARHEARACSCVGPHLSFLSPTNIDAAPTNTHVRIEAPSQNLQVSQFQLRVHDGATIATTAKTYPEAMVTIVELVPSAALPASTRFEVATVDPAAHPPTTVIATFKTGTTADTTAPRLTSLGKQRTRLNATFGGGMCSIAGPWVTFDDFVGADERAGTTLAFAIWNSNASGVVDTSRPYDAIYFAYQHTLSLGQTSLCDPRRFDFHGAGTVSFAIAALDDAGNASAAIRARADLTKNTP
jgi:hypothetical protein